jgi:hypothetical protein
VIGLNGFVSVNVLNRFPCVVAIGPTRPFDEILELLRPSMMSVADDVLHFKLLVAICYGSTWTIGSGFEGFCCGATCQ